MKLETNVTGKSESCASRNFTVCAHPCNFSVCKKSDASGVKVGFEVKMAFESDAADGAKSYLDKVSVKELIYGFVPKTSSPPFGWPVDDSDQQIEWVTATTSSLTDEQFLENYFCTHGDKSKHYTLTVKQLMRCKCERCGAGGENGIACKNSGFVISHDILYNQGWYHLSSECAIDVTIDNFSSSCGAIESDDNTWIWSNTTKITDSW